MRKANASANEVRRQDFKSVMSKNTIIFSLTMHIPPILLDHISHTILRPLSKATTLGKGLAEHGPRRMRELLLLLLFASLFVTLVMTPSTLIMIMSAKRESGLRMVRGFWFFWCGWLDIRGVTGNELLQNLTDDF